MSSAARKTFVIVLFLPWERVGTRPVLLVITRVYKEYGGRYKVVINQKERL
jgi:hypothetical protein